MEYTFTMDTKYDDICPLIISCLYKQLRMMSNIVTCTVLNIYV